ncbi:MAG: PQQ-binding-like beta-propeller repeat protein, partial [Bdellovibrionales bacterium]|nr:PQQ-binding-like beta-propeller repeat protein [Bdellovibrionales bacterium]
VLRGSRLIFGQETRIYALNTADGSVAWSIPAPSPRPTVTVTDDEVFIARPSATARSEACVNTQAGSLLSLDLKTGAKRWEQSGKWVGAGPVIVIDSHVLTGNCEGMISLSRSNGEIQWALPLRERQLETAYLLQETLVATSSTPQPVCGTACYRTTYGLDPEHGSARWRVTASDAFVARPVGATVVFETTSHSPRLKFVVDARSGRVTEHSFVEQNAAVGPDFPQLFYYQTDSEREYTPFPKAAEQPPSHAER